MNDDLVNVKKTAFNYSSSRCSTIGKSPRFKVNQTILREELNTACMYGELSALERILIFVQNNKGLSQEDLEASLHLSIVAINNYISEKIGRRDAKIKLDEYLELRGYFGKSMLGEDLEGIRQQ